MRCWAWRPARTRACSGVLIYLAIYLVTNVGVFACIQAMRRGGKAVENISDLAGLAQHAT